MTRRAESADVLGPAIVREDHVQDRELTTVAGGPRGYRRLTPLQSAFDKGQLGGGSQKYNATQRMQAGEVYERHFLTSQASGRNMLDLDRAFGSSGGTTLGQAQIDAIRALVSIDSHLGLRDRSIIRAVCGEGCWPSEAVSKACGTDFAKATLPRFREALDALIEALESVRRKPRAVNMEAK